MNTIVKLDKVSKKFGDKTIIDNVSLDIYEGEFITLLGPSGCGKTTILRMISGLESVTSGKVYIDNEDVTNVDATKRNVNTIFQNFALFPHMSVWDNINFGLKMHKVEGSEAENRIKNAIKLVKLEGFENRKPSELSGGQQQRVAIARGIVMNHKVLLLDESLASLDLKLKREMQIELKKIQKKLGMAFIYVTHDQDEALTMSDRIAIINNGKIEQLGTPKEIYRSPVTTFVADFIGESNILNGVIKENKNGIAIISIDDFSLKAKTEYKKKTNVTVIMRPEVINISKRRSLNSLTGKIVDYIYDGSTIKLVVELENKNKTQVKVNLFYADNFNLGDKVYLSIDDDKLILIGDENEKK